MTLNLRVNEDIVISTTQRNVEADNNERNVVLKSVHTSHLHDTEKSTLHHASPNHKSHLLKTVLSSKKRSFRNDTNETGGQGTCSMSKERVIEAKAVLLTPKSAVRVFGDKPHLLDQSFKTSPPQDLQPGRPVRLSSLRKDSETRDSITDSTSLVSDLSSLGDDDFDKTLTMTKVDNENNQTHSESDTRDARQYPSLFLKQDSEKSLYEQELTNVSSAHDNFNLMKTVQLSPSISLPISQIEGNFLPSLNIQTKDTVLQSQHYNLDDSDIESVDRSSEHSSYSCSSMSLDQDGILLSDFNGSQQNLNLLNFPHEPHLTYAKEVRELKQALKLAEADTAILVTSKQQLQLDNHDLNEANKLLKVKLQDARQEAAENKANVAVLTRTKEVAQEKHINEFEELKTNFEILKTKFEKLSEELETVSVEKDRLHNKNIENESDLKLSDAKLKHVEKEVNDIMNKNLKLERLLEQASQDSSGNNNYINAIRGERDDYAKEVQKQEREMINKLASVKLLEDRLSDVLEKNTLFSAEREVLEKSLSEKDDLVRKLQFQVSSVMREKEALDGAVSRLHGDLSRVESGFVKIRKDMAQKSGIARREGSLKSQLESEIASLKTELGRLRLESAAHAQRIGDKNNQISHLLAQLKTTTISKRNAEQELGVLKSHITVNENSWLKAVEQEGKCSRLVEEKSKALSETKEKLKQVSSLLATATSNQHKLEKSNQEKASSLSSKEKKIGALESDLKKCQVMLSDNDDIRKAKEDIIAELEKQLEDCKVAAAKYDEAKSFSDDSLNESSQQMLAELQACRRDLSEEINRMRKERELQRERHNQEKKEQLLLMEAKDKELQEEKQRNKNLEKEKDEDKHQHLMQVESESGKVLELSQQVGALQEQLADRERDLQLSKAELEADIKKLETLSKQNIDLREELTTAKKEINSVTLRLIDEMETKENKQDDKDNDIKDQLCVMELERDKLREAVEQQQRYAASLQTHYQQWAYDAAAKFQVVQNDSFSKKNVDTCEGGSQTDHESESFSPTKNLITAERKTSSSTSTQTSHDERPIGGSPPKNVTRATNEVQVCEKCKVSSPAGPQGDTSGLRKPEQRSSDNSLYSDFLEPVNYSNPFSPSLAPGVNVSTQTLTQACAVATQTLSVKDFDLFNAQAITLPQRAVLLPKHKAVDGDTQTTYDLHIVYDEDVSASGAVDYPSSPENMTDSFSQTDHDDEAVGKLYIGSGSQPCKIPTKKRDHQTQTPIAKNAAIHFSPDTTEQGTQTDHACEVVGETGSLVTLQSLAEDVCFHDDKGTTDSATQVDLEQVKTSLGRQLTRENESTDCSVQTDDLLNLQKPSLSESRLTNRDASVQTIHEMEPVSSHCVTLENEVPRTSSSVDKFITQSMEASQQLGVTSSFSQTNLAPQKLSETSDAFCQTDIGSGLYRKAADVSKNDSCVQTDHDQEIVGSLSRYDQYGALCSFKLDDAATQTDSNQFKVANSFVQTESDDFETPITRFSHSFCTFNDSFTQTDHKSEVVGHTHVKKVFSKAHELKDSGTQATVKEVRDSTQQTKPLSNEFFDDNSAPVCNHCVSSVLKPQVRFNANEPNFFNESSTQTSSPGLDTSLPPLPNPSDVISQLHTEDAAKLKAYKQTVGVLRRKLKQAEKKSLQQKDEMQSLLFKLECAMGKDDKGNCSNEADRALKNDLQGNDETARLSEELNRWKELAGKSDELSGSLQIEIDRLMKKHETEMNKMKRKNKANRMLQERKLKEANERMRALVDANEHLRKSLDKLQIKLTSSAQQLEVCRREKLRYQIRSRKYRADFRSLSWLPSYKENSHTEPTERYITAQSDGELSASFNSSATMKEIDDSLRDLRKEIVVLEEQLYHHSSAVHQSSANLKELRHDSSFNRSKVEDHDGKENGNSGSVVPDSQPTCDYIGSITDVV